MPPVQKGPSSGFAAAAKVLFDSAQRVGAVKPLESSTRQYAHQLKKIQDQSKKRGGSLGGVSYKVAEFLATQRTPPAQLNRSPHAGSRSVAKKVPLIDIPFSAKEKRGNTVRGGPVPSKEKTLSSTSKLVVPAILEASPRIEVPAVKPSEAQPTVKETSTRIPWAEEVLITEDKPLFENAVPSDPLPTVAPAIVYSRVPKPAPSEALPQRKPKPVIAVPIAAKRAEESETLPVLDSAVSPLSVDAWEQQREKELERLQKKQEEAEQVRLAALRAEEHVTLGKEWVERRSTVSSPDSKKMFGGGLLHDVYFAKSVEEAFSSFQKLLDSGARGVELLPSAIASIVFQIRKASVPQQMKLGEEFLDFMQRSKISEDLITKARLGLTGGETFLSSFRTLSPESKQRLDRVIVQKAVKALITNGGWEEAIEVVSQSHLNTNSRDESLQLTLLRNAFRLDAEAKKEVIAFASRNLTDQNRMGRTAKLLAARGESGVYRRSLLKQLAASPDVDEAVYAELIVRSDDSEVRGLLSELAKRGLNPEDPCILGAVALKSLGNENPFDTFSEIDQQIQRIGLRPVHVYVAIRAAKLRPTKESLQCAVSIVKQVDSSNSQYALRKILPVLFEHDRMEEIVELVDFFSAAVSLPNLLPNAVAFMNNALIRVGREPLSSLRVEDIGFVRSSSDSSREGAVHSIAAKSVDISGMTEKMLLYAKERQWVKALEVVTALPSSVKADASAVALVYNCAMSAAVDHPDAVLRVYALMKERSVAINPTTVNTVLSSLSKSSRWTEALAFFDAVPLANRDTNTFLVHFSLLGKHDLWEQAVSAYDEMRQAVAKPPASMFTLAISAMGPHSWSVTLRMFHDMLKAHGANVKDSVVMQVHRCLEQNNRSGEIAKLQSEMQKRRKKKK